MIKRIMIILGATLGLLFIPFIAMQAGGGTNWSTFDFLIAGMLLFGTGLLIDLAVRKVKTKKYRIIIIAGILIFLFLVWAELSVGIFGTVLAGN